MVVPAVLSWKNKVKETAEKKKLLNGTEEKEKLCLHSWVCLCVFSGLNVNEWMDITYHLEASPLQTGMPACAEPWHLLEKSSQTKFCEHTWKDKKTQLLTNLYLDFLEVMDQVLTSTQCPTHTSWEASTGCMSYDLKRSQPNEEHLPDLNIFMRLSSFQNIINYWF